MGRPIKRRGRPVLENDVRKGTVKGFRMSDKDIENMEIIAERYDVDESTAIRLAINLIGLEVVNKNKGW